MPFPATEHLLLSCCLIRLLTHLSLLSYKLLILWPTHIPDEESEGGLSYAPKPQPLAFMLQLCSTPVLIMSWSCAVRQEFNLKHHSLPKLWYLDPVQGPTAPQLRCCHDSVKHLIPTEEKEMCEEQEAHSSSLHTALCPATQHCSVKQQCRCHSGTQRGNWWWQPVAWGWKCKVWLTVFRSWKLPLKEGGIGWNKSIWASPIDGV